MPAVRQVATRWTPAKLSFPDADLNEAAAAADAAR